MTKLLFYAVLLFNLLPSSTSETAREGALQRMAQEADTVEMFAAMSYQQCLTFSSDVTMNSLCLYIALQPVYSSFDFDEAHLATLSPSELKEVAEMCNNYGVSVMRLHETAPR